MLGREHRAATLSSAPDSIMDIYISHPLNFCWGFTFFRYFFHFTQLATRVGEAALLLGMGKSLIK